MARVVVDFYDRLGGDWEAIEPAVRAFLMVVEERALNSFIRERARRMQEFLFSSVTRRAGVLIFYSNSDDDDDDDTLEYNRNEGGTKMSPHAYLSSKGWGYNDG